MVHTIRGYRSLKSGISGHEKRKNKSPFVQMCHRQRHTVDVSERDNCEREPSFLPLHVNYYYILYHTIVLQSFWLIRKPAVGMNSIVLRYFCASMSRQMGNRVIVWEKIFYSTTEQAYLLSLLIETKYSGRPI